MIEKFKIWNRTYINFTIIVVIAVKFLNKLFKCNIYIINVITNYFLK